jgi:hypothetical protein
MLSSLKITYSVQGFEPTSFALELVRSLGTLKPNFLNFRFPETGIADFGSRLN